MLMSYPDSSRWVANECLSMWQLARLSTPAVSTALLTAFCKPPSAVWKRQTSPVLLSGLSTADGKTNCHRHSLVAFGYLRSSACGRGARPCPLARSLVCSALTLASWSVRGPTSDDGNTVTRSFPPLL